MKERVKVAYLGPEGTFSQAAAVNQFGNDCDLRDCDSIDDVFSIVASEEVDYGVVPVENSTEGAVNNTQDCLIDSTVQIVGEVILPIQHCLLTKPGAETNEIEKIASHKQSLAQCRNWIQQSFPQAELIECPSNAQAAKLVLGDNSIAAIAGSLAAKVYGLSIRQEQIQDQHHNSTRFLVLANHSTESSGNDKTSVLIYTENRPGALFRILKPFESLQVSLTKIETRPAKNEAWAYVFFIDFEGHVNAETIIELFRKLVACTAEIKILGSYPIFVSS